MNRITRLSEEFGQSPWLDNLKRSYLTSGELAAIRDRGVRGLTSNPSIFQKAIQGSPDYDDQFRELAADEHPVLDDYWALVVHDIHGACDVFSKVYDETDGLDGYVSVEVAPGLAHDGPGTEAAARELHEQLHRRNLMVKIPATHEGLAPIRQMISEGRSINVTLIFALDRHQAVMDAYLDGLETFGADPSADLSQVASVASFFISRVDVEVDRRLEAIGTPEALALRGQAALAQGQLAYRNFSRTFSGPRWEALAARGARVQRPLWASTGTKNPEYSDVLYVDHLIGPDTVNTLPEPTLEAFADHGTLARTVDADLDEADRVWQALADVGVDMDDVARQLETEGVDSFMKSFDELIAALQTKADELPRRLTVSEIRFDRVPRFAELTAWLQQLANEYPDLVQLDVLGSSHEGRELWIATVTNRAIGQHLEKPAVWLDGNIHASETTASVALLHLLHRLCTGYGVDERITRALDTRTFYIVPRVNPDGAELALGEVPFIVRSTVREWPRAEQADGLVISDVDHDGRILQMRVVDVNGTWKASGVDHRLLVPREPDEDGAGPYYRVFREGRIQNYDGVTVPLAVPVHGIDSNRNFPFAWERYPGKAPTGAGDHPMSEPEVRAVVEGVTARPNITAYFAYHTFSGVHLRPYGNQSQDAYPTVDLWTFRDLGERYTAITGYPAISILEDFRYDPKSVIGGSGSDWAYDQVGLIAWTTEFWNPMKAAGIEESHPIEWFRDHPIDDEFKLLAWVDDHVVDGFVDWYEFEHPQLGTVELGGWNSAAVFRNPPPDLLEAEIAPHSELAIFQALTSPELRLRDILVEPAGSGAWRIRVVVENAGWLPTNVTQMALDRRAVLPLRAEITLPDGASLVTGSTRLDLGQLAGRALKRSGIGMFAFGSDDTGDRAVAEWLVVAETGTSCEVEVRHDRAGVVRVSVDLVSRP